MKYDVEEIPMKDLTSKATGLANKQVSRYFPDVDHTLDKQLKIQFSRC